MPLRATLVTLALLALTTPAAAQQPAADAKTLVSRLSSLDYPTRTEAARNLRRLPVPEAVLALTEAVAAHPDEYVRFRALVLLTGFNDSKTADLIRTLLGDKSDRLREAAYRWFAQHPDPSLTDRLLTALGTEPAEFVRPAVVRALAALGKDPQVQRALLGEIGRGFDFFRIAVIDALGEAKAQYAVAAIVAAGEPDGPLQDDAVLALGRIGDAQALKELTSAPTRRVDVTMATHAARCLVGDDCASHLTALAAALTGREAAPDVLRAAAGGLAAVAAQSDAGLETLVNAAAGASGDVRDIIAVYFGGVALRRPERVIAALQGAPPERVAVMIELLHDGFESLEEDLAEEQFFAAARAAYWKAPEHAPSRDVMATVIQKLDF